MNSRKLAVIGVGNMAKAVICGLLQSEIPVTDIILYDKNSQQYENFLENPRFRVADSAASAMQAADCVLLAVKPQNYDEVLTELAALPCSCEKLYISIAAGITSYSVSERLSGACVIRVLPNVPMLIGKGVSLICRNPNAKQEDFDFVCRLFCSAGSIQLIEETDMNRMIGVTSSSPAYVFRFIQAIYEGALAQGLPDENLLNSICDVVIGSAQMVKESTESPEGLVARVASKGGTTEKALETLGAYRFNEAVGDAMRACTARADELGQK